MDYFTNNINHFTKKSFRASAYKNPETQSGKLEHKEKTYIKNKKSDEKVSKYYKRLPFAGNRLGNEIGKLSLSASHIDNKKTTSLIDNVTWDIAGTKDRPSLETTSSFGESKKGNIGMLYDYKRNIDDSGNSPLATRDTNKKKLAFASNSLTQKIPYTLNFNKNFIFCKESHIESPTSFYGSFYIGPFDESLCQTLAHNIRRTLLSELTGLAITSVEIDGVLHKFSSIPGVKETVLDILCNLQTLVFKKAQGLNNIYGTVPKGSPENTGNNRIGFAGMPLSEARSKAQQNDGLPDDDPLGTEALYEGSETILQTLPINQIAFLRVRGPGIVKASDIILSSGIECVNPEQYIATLAEDGILNMKIYINEGKNAIKQTQKQVGDQDFFESNSPLGLSTDQRSSGGHMLWSDISEEDSETSPSAIQETPWDSLSTNNSLKSNRIYLDSVFMPVTKVNAFVETNFKATDDLLEKNINYKALKSKTITEITQKLQKNLSEKVHSDVEPSRSVNVNLSGEVLEQELSNLFFSFLPPSTSNILVSQSAKTTEVTDISKQKQAAASYLGGPHIIISDSTKMDLGSDTAGPLAVLEQPNRQCNIVIEIWTNGSIHPRLALRQCLEYLTTTFITLNNIKMLGSMYKSDLTYMKILGRNNFYSGAT